MKCAKCGGLMLPGNDQGRQAVPGEGAAMLSISMYYCSACSRRVYPEQQPVKPLCVEEMAPNRLQQYTGGRKAGNDNPAAEVVVQNFRTIAAMRRRQKGWEPITQRLVELSGKKFCWRSLKRFYELEVEARKAVKS